MNVEALIKVLGRVLAKRPARMIAGTFLNLTAVIILVGYLKGYQPGVMFLAILAAGVVSLAALGFRWIERRWPVE